MHCPPTHDTSLSLSAQHPPASPACWATTRFRSDLCTPQVMGIVKVTPDSFSDGGRYANAEAAIRRCEALVKQGAAILDIGGESTRPGSPRIPLEEELARITPVVAAALTLGVPVSVDTYKAEVMRIALDWGVDIINDVWALRQPGALQTVAAHPHCGICLMHMHGEPSTMQIEPLARDAVQVTRQFFEDALPALRQTGIAADRICLDPGIGFGKTTAQNFALLREQASLASLGYPLLAGWSRKRSLGEVTGIVTAADRTVPSVVAAVLAVERGAHVVRVHDVAETVSALAVWRALAAPSPLSSQ